jgi:hypothetical protein
LGPVRLRFLALVLLPSLAHADFFSSSPGPLAQSHAALDSQDHCQDCHAGARDLSNDKCIACHKIIGERQREHVGVHASPKAAQKPCELCHTDHKGRGREILGWASFGGRDKFDHNAFTPFRLEGRHANTNCNKCHTQRTPSGTQTYLKASTGCASCHSNPHGDLREPMRRCERCHDARSWKMLEKAEFDHDRDTRYPIERRHEGVRCEACHAKKPSGEPPHAKAAIPPAPGGYQKLTFRSAGWSLDCMPCHDNVHGASLFGQKACKLCHSAKVEFTRIGFDHNRRTKFALDGGHAKTKCESCHKKDERKAPSQRCETCHEDTHRGRFEKVSSGDCAACHTAANWPTDLKFNHNDRTKFALSGAHANADCRACHRGKAPAEWENVAALMTKGGRVECMGCHQHENVHNKQYTNEKCLDCHKMAGIVETKPRAVNEFHGANSKFPLTEGHKGVPCAKCHPGNIFTNTPLQCGPRCHPDELHKATLGNDCLNCHAGGKWEARLFDHDTKTHWPLVGNHREVLCEGCHPRRDFANNQGKGKSCINCHEKDDAHQGALGRRCETCHSPDGKVAFDHNDKKFSDWPLEGKHQEVRCGDCHRSLRFKPTSRDCGGCHPEPDVHRGQLGTLCAVCHDAFAWSRIRTGHNVPTPKFAGAHEGIACVRCHPGGRLLQGTGNLCITCHRSDDIHHNALGPRCGDCHTQRAWVGVSFNHERVGCELTGVHRLLPCVDCHKGGNFTSLAAQCIACHRGDALRAERIRLGGGAPQLMIPPHGGLTTCANCHNTQYFGPASKAGGRESVCR